MKKNNLKKIALILFGDLLMAMATVFFLVPAGFITGGATGVSLFLEQYLHLDISYGIAIVSILLLAVGWICLGKKFAASTALSSIGYPICVWLCEYAVKYLDITTDSITINLAFCTLLYGYGYAIIMRQGASTGGLDVIGMILYEKRGVSLAASVAILEVCAMAPQVVYSTADGILGGILLTILYTAAMNYFIAQGTARVQVMVYSPKYEDINSYIDKVMNRGSTLYHVQGGFGRKDTFALQTIVSHRELFKLKEAVLKIDPSAFMTISQMSQVSGKGFTLEQEMLEKITVGDTDATSVS